MPVLETMNAPSGGVVPSEGDAPSDGVVPSDGAVLSEGVVLSEVVVGVPGEDAAPGSAFGVVIESQYVRSIQFVEPITSDKV